MNDGGIDTTVHKTQSIRLPSSTKAVEFSHSQDKHEEYSNWSIKANSFNKYYYNPIAHQSSNTKIASSILSFTENCTTLTDVAESREIVVGTINNFICVKGNSFYIPHTLVRLLKV